MLCTCAVQCFLSFRWHQCNLRTMHNSHKFLSGSSQPNSDTSVSGCLHFSMPWPTSSRSKSDVTHFSDATHAGHQVRISQDGLQMKPTTAHLPIQNSHATGHADLLKKSRMVKSAALEWAHPSKGPWTDPMNLMQEAAASLTPSLVRIIHCNAHDIGV